MEYVGRFASALVFDGVAVYFTAFIHGGDLERKNGSQRSMALLGCRMDFGLC
jgi:hypothetical protein